MDGTRLEGAGARHLLGRQPALCGPVRRQHGRVHTHQQHAAARVAIAQPTAALVAQQSLALGKALKARRGKAVPVRIREIVGTLEGVTAALPALRRLTLGLNVMDMDDSMGKIIMLRMRWGRLLEFVDEESDWITRLVTEARWKVAEGVDEGKLSSRFKTLMNRAAASFGIETEAPVDENRPPKIRRLSEGEGVRVKWDSDDDL